jgi:hypothetical protein
MAMSTTEKNVYDLDAVKAVGEDERVNRWILASSYREAQGKAKKYLTTYSKERGVKFIIEKLEYQGEIDIF